MKTNPKPLLPPPTRAAQVADKYIVRFPDGMRDKIAEAAKANNRSMNAEIVARLHNSLIDNPAQDRAAVIPDGADRAVALATRLANSPDIAHVEEILDLILGAIDERKALHADTPVKRHTRTRTK